MESDQIGVNIASMLLPWSAVPVVGLPIAAWMTRRSGYTFWQVLPLRSVTVAGLRRTGIPVRFVEPAWNATTFLGHLRGKLGSEGMPTKWQDPLFFPAPRRCDDVLEDIVEECQATPIWHHAGMIGPPGLVEIHPSLGLTVGMLVAEAYKWPEWRRVFVVDLRHLRRRAEDGFSFGSWREALAALLPFTGLIHVQAFNGSEWRRFLSGEPNTLAGILRFAAEHGYAGPFVVEFDPRATSLTGLLPWKLANNLRLVRERVEELTT